MVNSNISSHHSVCLCMICNQTLFVFFSSSSSSSRFFVHAFLLFGVLFFIYNKISSAIYRNKFVVRGEIFYLRDILERIANVSRLQVVTSSGIDC